MIELMPNPLLSDWCEVGSDVRGKALCWGHFRPGPGAGADTPAAPALPDPMSELSRREMCRRGLLGSEDGWSLAPVAAWLAIEGRLILDPVALLNTLAMDFSTRYPW